jgi:hypothetical protein
MKHEQTEKSELEPRFTRKMKVRDERMTETGYFCEFIVAI